MADRAAQPQRGPGEADRDGPRWGAEGRAAGLNNLKDGICRVLPRLPWPCWTLRRIEALATKCNLHGQRSVR
jgi:hypothetical protein